MLRYAYFHGFPSGPALLIWGRPMDLQRLYEGFALIATEDGPASLTEISGTRSVDGSTVLFETTGEAEGLLRDEIEPDVFHWRVDREGWEQFQRKIAPLMHSPESGSAQCYLRCRADEDIAVMVSCGIFPDDFKP